MTNLLQEARRPQTIPSGADLGVKKILVAVDLSPHSEKTAAFAAELAVPFGASIALVHVCSPKETTKVTDGTDPRFGEAAIAPEEELAKLVRKVRQTNPSCSAHLVVGDPAEKIVLMAETLAADLIVTGNHHPSYLGQLLGLNQPSRVLRHSPCPVLVYNGSE
jgi:nucleotide-binding universal stress UspA family protein